jgi:hypothetical protein
VAPTRQLGWKSVRNEIGPSYRRLGASSVAFRVAAYDHRKPLVIDPTLSYSTYLGEYLATILNGPCKNQVRRFLSK